MIDDTHPVPQGFGVALLGLDVSAERLRESAEGILHGRGGRIGTSLTESLFWLGALNAHAAKAVPDYFRLRDASAPVVGGLVYARNFHADELAVSTSEMAITIGKVTVVSTPPGEPHPRPGRGTIFSVQLRCVELAGLPPPGKPEICGGDILYRDHVELRPLTEPIDEARQWLRELLQTPQHSAVQ